MFKPKTNTVNGSKSFMKWSHFRDYPIKHCRARFPFADSVLPVAECFYSPIHKAAGLTVHGRSTGLPGIIPKISKETAVQNALQTPFCTAAGRTAAL